MIPPPRVAYDAETAGIRILFVGNSHLPQIGGAEVSTDHLVRALSDRGHIGAVLTGRPQRFVAGLRGTATRKPPFKPRRRIDHSLGYDVTYSVIPADSFLPVASQFRPDVVVVSGTDPLFAVDILRRSAPWPTVLFVRDVAFTPVAKDGSLHIDGLIANSKFLAREASDGARHAIPLPALVDPDVYDVPTTRKIVLFVNPIPRKGVGIAWALAEERPEIPFAFVPSWPLRPRVLLRLRMRARHTPNVQIRRRVLDPRRLYSDCRVALIPSIGSDAVPRVIREAQASGIPALASRTGGVPEAVGPGGILVSPDAPIEEWVRALSRLWHDEGAYERLATRAREHSRREELDTELILDRFELLMQQAVRRHERECQAAGRPGLLVLGSERDLGAGRI